MTPPSSSPRGLMLVEVALALGIIIFGLVAALGLLPLGLGAVRDSADESVAINILAALDADACATPEAATATPRYGIPLGTAGEGTLSFDETGRQTTPSAAIYLATWQVRERDGHRPPSLHLAVAWPAATPSRQVEALLILEKDPAPPQGTP